MKVLEIMCRFAVAEDVLRKRHTFLPSFFPLYMSQIKHGITITQNLSDTVKAWMRLGHQNMCGTLKDHGLDNNLSWGIHKKASAYQCGSNSAIYDCPPKKSIICADPDTLLNKRTELISKCRNRNKFPLANVKK